MNKKLFICMGVIIVVILSVVCLIKPISSLFDNGDRRYALNLYGEDFKYTRGLEAFYDRNGELISIEVYLIYDSSSFEISGGSNNAASKYPGAEISSVVFDDGRVRISNFLTSESIEAGALNDNAFYMVNALYDKIRTEDAVKLFFEEQIQLAKQNGIPANETNYIIMSGKNVKW